MTPWWDLRRWRSRPLRAASSARRDQEALLDRRFLAQIEQLRLADLGTILAGLAGEHEGRSRTQSIEFTDYRGYVPGDDFRQIDWNAYARLGELYVKTSVAEESVSLSLLIDCSRSMDWGHPSKLHYAKQLAAALGAVALLHYDSIRIYALGDGRAEPGTPLRGQASLPLLLRELDSLKVASTTELLPAIEDFRSFAEPQGVNVLLSDLLVGDNQEAAVTHLSGDGTRGAILHIVDPLEAEPSMSGLLQLRDMETGQIMELTVTPGLRKRYEARLQAREEALQSVANAAQVRYIRVQTDEPPSDVILQTLRRQGLVLA